MAPRLDQSFLERECDATPSADPAGLRQLLRVASALGPLQSNWLTDEALAALGMTPATLPEIAPAGEFHILVAVRGSYALLRPAFLLPLRWGRDRPHSPRLPPALVAHADVILGIHREVFGHDPDVMWGLHTPLMDDEAEDAATLDLSGLDIDPSSASAAMLAGLRLAQCGTCGKGQILASVACSRGSIGSVGSIAAKLDAAAQAGAARVFLCQDNRPEGDAWVRASGRGDLVEYLPQQTSLQESLGPFMRASVAAPAPGASIDEHRRFVEDALSGQTQGAMRRDYFLGFLAQRLAEDHVARFPEGPRPGQHRLLAGVVSPEQMPTLAFLAHVYAPEVVLLIYDKERAEGDAVALRRHLERMPALRQVEEFTDNLADLPIEELERLLRERLRRFCDDHTASPDGADLVCDLTAGLKRISFAMFDVVPPATQRIHVDTRRAAAANFHRIGSECIRVLGGGRVPGG